MKKKRNLTKKELEAMANWERLNKQWDKLPKFARHEHAKEIPKLVVPSIPDFRRAPDIPSLMTRGSDSTPKKENQKYTGNAILGIGTLHKSSAIPVFSEEEAIEIAQMRR